MTSDTIRRSRTRMPALLGAAALAVLAGCTQGEKTADVAAANAQAAAQAQNNPTLSTSDSLFIDQAARSGLAEVQEGQVAQQQARRAAVRQFAAMMVTDHSAVNDQLMALAQQKQITPPNAPTDLQRGDLTRLQAMKGAAFDRQYLDEQVADHQQVLNLFQTEAQQGTDPDVKAFAAKYAPTIAHHLEEAEKLGGHAPTS